LHFNLFQGKKNLTGFENLSGLMANPASVGSHSKGGFRYRSTHPSLTGAVSAVIGFQAYDYYTLLVGNCKGFTKKKPQAFRRGFSHCSSSRLFVLGAGLC